jgi:hypothetical protein
MPCGSLTWTLTGVAWPSAEREAGKLMTGVAEKTANTAKATEMIKMRITRSVFTAIIQDSMRIHRNGKSKAADFAHGREIKPELKKPAAISRWDAMGA